MRRVEWIDVAKGLTIILIVMYHARDYALSLVPPGPDQPFRWVYIDPLLRCIRMPLFFLISGMLASGVFSGRAGSTGYNVQRARSLLLVYLIWSVPLLIIVPDWPHDGWRLPTDPKVILDLARGCSVLWYLWAVPVLFGFAWVVRGLPPFAATMVSAAVGFLLCWKGDLLGGFFPRLGIYLPFYIIGIRYPFAVIQIAQTRNLQTFLALFLGYGVMLHVKPDLQGFDTVRQTLGVPMAIMAIAWAVDHWPRMTDRLAWLGQRTLPVYIFHFPLLALLGTTAVRHGQFAAHWQVTIWLFLPLLSVAVIAISLGIFALLRQLRLGWTIAMPKYDRPHMPPLVPVQR